MKKNSDLLSKISQDVVDIPIGQKLLVLLVAISVILTAYYHWSYRSKSTQINWLQQNIRKTKTRLAILRRKSIEVKKLEIEVKTARKKLEQVSYFLPKQKEIPSLLDSISAYGKKEMLDFLLFQPEAENSKDFYAEIPITIEVRGTYQQVAVFLDKLSHMDRIVSTGNLEMAIGGMEDENVILVSRFTATTYRFIRKSNESEKNNKKEK